VLGASAVGASAAPVAAEVAAEAEAEAEEARREGAPLLDLGPELVRGVLLRRPSARNRSPYVADVALEDGREVLAHVPSLDLGGKCLPGMTLLLKPARDKKGSLVGADAVSAQYGTPKCEFIAQLARVDESEIGGPCLWNSGSAHTRPLASRSPTSC